MHVSHSTIGLGSLSGRRVLIWLLPARWDKGALVGYGGACTVLPWLGGRNASSSGTGSPRLQPRFRQDLPETGPGAAPGRLRAPAGLCGGWVGRNREQWTGTASRRHRPVSPNEEVLYVLARHVCTNPMETGTAPSWVTHPKCVYGKSWTLVCSLGLTATWIWGSGRENARGKWGRVKFRRSLGAT